MTVYPFKWTVDYLTFEVQKYIIKITDKADFLFLFFAKRRKREMPYLQVDETLGHNVFGFAC